MTAGSTLLRGRKAAEALMVDACTVTRITGETVTTTGAIINTTAPVYAGKCRIQVRTRERLGGSGREIGEAYVIVSRLELHLPMTVPDILEGDLVVITASLYDPNLVNRPFTVRDSINKTHLTSRRITILEVSS